MAVSFTRSVFCGGGSGSGFSTSSFTSGPSTPSLPVVGPSNKTNPTPCPRKNSPFALPRSRMDQCPFSNTTSAWIRLTKELSMKRSQPLRRPILKGLSKRKLHQVPGLTSAVTFTAGVAPLFAWVMVVIQGTTRLAGVRTRMEVSITINDCDLSCLVEQYNQAHFRSRNIAWHINAGPAGLHDVLPAG